jgi:large subunit ribosomal protein L24
MARRTPEQRSRVALKHEGWDHGHARPLDIRSGDTVVVIAGRDAGKRGTVDRVLVAEQRLVVRGVNTLKRHTRAGVRGNVQGGIVDFDAPIHYSNVQLVCSRCDKPTRIAHGTGSDGSRVIICKKCGEQHERVPV